MAKHLSRRNLLKFSRMQQERLDNYELLLIALALPNGGTLRITDDMLIAARDAVTDECRVDIERLAGCAQVVVHGAQLLTQKTPELEIISVEA